MKLLSLVTVGFFLVSILASEATVFSEEARTIDTDGQVFFVPNDEEPTEVEPPAPQPPVVIPPVGPPGQTGPLTIAYAPILDFGSQVISNRDMAYNLVAEIQTRVNEEGDPMAEDLIPYVSFAQVQDTRGSNAGWNLDVTLSSFKSGTQNNELRGAMIEFISPFLQYNGNNIDSAPSIHMDGLKLEANGSQQNMLMASDRKGAGVSSVVWGDQEDLMFQLEAGIENIENKSIKLHIPGATAKDATTYTATLTWNLASTADSNGETIPESKINHED